MSRAREIADRDLAATELILDADNDTSITADTDDQIDIRIAGADDFAFKANKFEVQTGSNIDMNGTELILDADGDSSITADTDDQIDFKTGGTDRMSIKSTGQIFIGNTSGNLPSTTMGVNSAGRHIIANDGAGYLLLQDNSTAAQNNGFDIHMGGVPAGTATNFSGGSIGGFVENGTNADGYLKFSTSLDGTITEAMRINSDGAVTKTKQPCFRASVQNSTGSTVGVQSNLTFNRENIDLGGNYDTSNGRFTAPVDGTYYFSHAGLGASGTSGATHPSNASWHVEFLKNGSRTFFQFYWYAGNTSGGDTQAHYVNSYIDMIITLSAGDYITVQLPDGTDSYYINPNSNATYEPYFQGFLIA